MSESKIIQVDTSLKNATEIKKIDSEIKRLERRRESLVGKSDGKGKRTGQGTNFKEVFDITTKLLALKNASPAPSPDIPVRSISKSVS